MARYPRAGAFPRRSPRWLFACGAWLTVGCAKPSIVGTFEGAANENLAVDGTHHSASPMAARIVVQEVGGGRYSVTYGGCTFHLHGSPRIVNGTATDGCTVHVGAGEAHITAPMLSVTLTGDNSVSAIINGRGAPPGTGEQPTWGVMITSARRVP